MKNLFYSALLALSFITILSSCGSSEGKDYVESTVEDPTQGIIAHIQEVKTDLFKITDEEIIDKRENSLIYATYMDKTVDTFTLDQIKLVEANNPRRSMMRSVVYGGMMGYMLGRGLGSGLSRGSYASDGAYNKSNSAGRSRLRSTANKRTVRTPKPKSSSGFGSKKSTRSYGG